MKLRWRKELVVELTAAEVIEACRKHAIDSGVHAAVEGRPLSLVSADGFDDHDRTFALHFKQEDG